MLGNSRAGDRGRPGRAVEGSRLGCVRAPPRPGQLLRAGVLQSWLFWLPYVLSQNGLGVLDVSFPEILGTRSSPASCPAPTSGRWGRRSSLRPSPRGGPASGAGGGRLFRWGVNWRWYALALLGVPALLCGRHPGGVARGGRRPAFPPCRALLAYLPFLVLQMLTTALAEEPWVA